jgi:two-component system, OmpR family, phosphate regulon sensor histidine kinase PhoR
MNSTKPYTLVFLASSIILLCYIGALLALGIFVYHHIEWISIIAGGLIIAVISYYTFSIVLKRYIDDRIKLVYKTIHNLKRSKDEKTISVNLNDDLIAAANTEVMEWADKRKDEIERLKNLETYRREFLGNVSHELKTPIFNIQGYILTLLDGAIDDPNVNKDYLQKSEKNIERMINIVTDLEIISQLESGNIKLEFTKFDLVYLTREVFELLEIKAKQKRISMVFHDGVTKDTQILVYADRERIKQVLINLCENSIKYGIEGGRTKVSYYDMFDNVLMEVSDDGIGISSEHIPRLFERFYRVDKSRSRNIGGSGLGLAIVKHIMESHQQTVNVRSAPGIGSTFSITLNKKAEGS